MSNLDTSDSADCKDGECSGLVSRLLQPGSRDLGGFSVRRVLPQRGSRSVGPWVFFDHMGPADFEPGQGIDVRPHPHINLATVTYLFDGEIMHRDSLGSVQAIRPGDLNLMVAGRGIVHSERSPDELRAAGHTLHGLQLWHALPEADEETDPEFLHYPGDVLPRTTVGDVPLRVMMGRAYGEESPVKTFAETLYVEAALRAGDRLQLPASPERAVYVAAGAVDIDGTQVPEFAMAILQPGDGDIVATENSRIAIVGGEPLGLRYMEWNFVSSRRARIDQAKQDWRAGNFPQVPGDTEEFIPLPEDQHD